MLIHSSSTITSELRYARTDDPELRFRVLVLRERGHEYSADHLDGRWIIRTNWDARNFRIMEAPVDARALEVLLESGGDRRLGELVAAIAEARGESVETIRALIDPTVRQLVERGFMVPVSNPRQGGQTW